MKKTTNGFTIVEVLIVIVVIAILAAITIVAYNGIQTRAKNVQTISAANDLIKALKLYKAANGSYPKPDVAGKFACVGLSSDGLCTANVSWVQNDAFDNALKSVASPLSANAYLYTEFNTSDPSLGFRPNDNGGAAAYLDGEWVPWVVYMLKGAEKCTAGSPASGGFPNFSSAAPSTGYTGISDGNAHCWIPME